MKRYWQHMDKIRENNSKRAMSDIKRGLNAHFVQCIQAFQKNGFNPTSLDSVGIENIHKSIKNIYLRTSLQLAFFEYDRITGSKKSNRRYIVDLNGKRVDIIEKWYQTISNFVNQSTAEAVVGIGDTTKELLKKVLSEGMQEGLGITDIQKNMVSKWKDLLPYRAANIARTETLSAMNYGSELGAEQTGFPYNKTWLTALDGREREAHAQANNQTVAAFQNFQVGGESLQYPGDPSASAANRVNCRCTVVREVI